MVQNKLTIYDIICSVRISSWQLVILSTWKCSLQAKLSFWPSCSSGFYWGKHSKTTPKLVERRRFINIANLALIDNRGWLYETQANIQLKLLWKDYFGIFLTKCFQWVDSSEVRVLEATWKKDDHCGHQRHHLHHGQPHRRHQRHEHCSQDHLWPSERGWPILNFSTIQST